jgi:hypothetical protein
VIDGNQVAFDDLGLQVPGDLQAKLTSEYAKSVSHEEH